jgi:hypothetical protein
LKLGKAAGKIGDIAAIWSKACDGPGAREGLGELRSADCLKPLLSQAGFKRFKDAFQALGTAFDQVKINKKLGDYISGLSEKKGAEFLKWLDALPADKVVHLSKTIAKALDKLEFDELQFGKLMDDLREAPDLIDEFGGKDDAAKIWLKLFNVGKTTARKSLSVYRGLRKLNEANIDEVLAFSDETLESFAKFVDETPGIAEVLNKNDFLVKGLVAYKDPVAYGNYLDEAVEWVESGEKGADELKDWVIRSSKLNDFLNRMAEARRYADDIIAELSSKFVRIQKEVTFIIRETDANGNVIKETRTRLDAIGRDANGDFVAVECKMGNANYSDNQRLFFDILKNGRAQMQIIPVGDNARNIFGIFTDKDVLSKLSKTWYLNKTLQP